MSSEGKSHPTEGLMKAIEVMGTVDEQGQLSLDVPLTVDQRTSVRVIVLLPEKADQEDRQENEEISESAVESFRQGWYDAIKGNTLPVSQLWKELMHNDSPLILIEVTANFQRNLRILAKKYSSIRNDIQPIIEQIQAGELPGNRIPGLYYTIFKRRVKNSDVQKNKSDGYRLIYYAPTSTIIILVTIYSKSEQKNISTAEIQQILADFEHKKPEKPTVMMHNPNQLSERSRQTPQSLAVKSSEQFLGLFLRLNPVADALISSYSSQTNYGNRAQLSAGAWTISGRPNLLRSLLKFDIPSRPNNYQLLLARLFLFAEVNTPMYGQGTYNAEPLGHSQLGGSNEWCLLPVVSPWSEDTVNWATQPSTIPDKQLFLPASCSSTQDYKDIDVTHLVQTCFDTGINHGFLMKLKTEVYYREVTFHSRKAENLNLRPRLDLYYAEL